MPESLTGLEQQRVSILPQTSELDDSRASSITGTGGRYGNPGCQRHREGDSHRLHPRLTCKVNGKTVTESFATPAEQQIRALYPGCPPEEAAAIAEHAAQR